VTCPSLLRYRPAAAEFFGDVSHARHLRAAVRTGHARIRRDDALAQFARFVLVGGASTAVYGLLFVTLPRLEDLPAHVIATIASSILANEMHRRLTFRAEDRVNWLSAQVEAGGVTLLGLLATSVALGRLNSAVDSTHAVLQISVVAVVTAAIGLMRFVALRWIFRPTGAPAAR
jgi:putative flippase GtrA